MPIDLRSEDVVTIAEAVQGLPPHQNGRKIHISTIYRWISRGIHGVRLESLKLGRRLVTSHEAIQRFAERLSEPRGPGSPHSLEAARHAERFEEELDRNGF